MSLSLRIISRSGQPTRVIQRLEGHAGGQRTIADDGHGAAIFTALAAAMAMPNAALIEVLECPTPKVSYSLSVRVPERAPGHRLLDGVQLRATAGQYLVGIGLMSHIPDQAVMRGIEHVMQGDGQFDRAQTRGEMARPGCSRSGSGTGAIRRRAAPVWVAAGGADRPACRWIPAADRYCVVQASCAVYTVVASDW
jgi:hypothetical protein